MPTSSEKLLERMERSHQDLLERIDKLDEQITEILKNWNELTPGDPLFIENSIPNNSNTSTKGEKNTPQG